MVYIFNFSAMDLVVLMFHPLDSCAFGHSIVLIFYVHLAQLGVGPHRVSILRCEAYPKDRFYQEPLKNSIPPFWTFRWENQQWHPPRPQGSEDPGIQTPATPRRRSSEPR